jgi:hypothetical protein
LQVSDYHHPEAHSKGLAPARNLGGVEDFVNELRSMQVTPHVAQNTSVRRSRIDGRTTRHAGYVASQRIRKRLEEALAGSRRWPVRRRGVARVGFAFTFAAAAYNLVRLPKLLAETG